MTTLRPFGCSGSSLSQADALRRLNQASAKDMTKMLAAQLIAAKLNVANGANNAIQPIINDSDSFLCAYPIGSALGTSDRNRAEQLKNQLDAYNNGGTLTDDGWELED
ncbi:MAG: hypothetical protein M1396_01960 [Chloroflexi bacterium]|nr:hypothetical protein [Chloroflexota bacterium]